MSESLSRSRLYLMRFAYLFNAVVIGFGAGSELMRQRAAIYGGQPWDLLYGIAFSLYMGYALLMLWGVRFPVRMLPLLLLQCSYKLIWLVAIAYPLWSLGRMTPAATGNVKFFATIVVFDLIVIPWPLVLNRYVVGVFRVAAGQPPSAPGPAAAHAPEGVQPQAALEQPR